MASTGEAVRSDDRAARRIHYTQLDSVRGIAALVVVISHALILFEPTARATVMHGRQDGWLWWLYNTPLITFWGGQQAVVLFFVLSGFVLALPFVDGRGRGYGDFVLRRWARLWPPYVAAIVVALLVRAAVGGIPVTGLSGWFDVVWARPFTSNDAFTHLAMLTFADSTQTTPVLWSLTVEIRIALLLPLLVWAARRRPGLTLGATLAVAAASAAAFTEHGFDPDELFVTGLYLPVFMVGILLAKHRHQIVERVGSWLTPTRLAGTLAAAVLLFTSRTVVFYDYEINSFVPTLAVTGGCALFLVVALASPAAVRQLTRPPMVFLGRVSYSLYLVHTSVLFGLVHLTAGVLPPWVAAVVGVPLSIPLAWAGYRWVEVPAIRVGQRLSKVLGEIRSDRSARRAMLAA